MARNRDELKKGLPKLESMLIDFLLDSGIGPKHIKGNIVLQYAPKIQELCDSITKIRQTALKEIDGGSETPEELEEAAEEYIKKGKYLPEAFVVRPAFIAGAKWQADHTPLPEDTVLFNKGVAEGKRLMMEEAVEKTVFQITRERTPVVMLTLDANEYKDGDKVHVIVIPNIDEK